MNVSEAVVRHSEPRGGLPFSLEERCEFFFYMVNKTSPHLRYLHSQIVC